MSLRVLDEVFGIDDHLFDDAPEQFPALREHDAKESIWHDAHNLALADDALSIQLEGEPHTNRIASHVCHVLPSPGSQRVGNCCPWYARGTAHGAPSRCCRHARFSR